MSLLEKARTVRRDKRLAEPVTAEEMELAVAWINGEVTTIQVGTALGEPDRTKVRSRMTTVLRAGVKQGRIAVELGE